MRNDIGRLLKNPARQNDNFFRFVSGVCGDLNIKKCVKCKNYRHVAKTYYTINKNCEYGEEAVQEKHICRRCNEES